MTWNRCLLLLLGLMIGGECAKILVVIPFTSKSHYLMQRPIGLELARRGHQVTVITSNVERNPPKNYEQIITDYKPIWELNGPRPHVFELEKLTFTNFEDFLWDGCLWTTVLALNSSTLQKFIADDRRSYDLVIAELFFQEALYMFSHIYQAPLVLISTFGESVRLNHQKRNPLQLAYVAHEYSSFYHPMNIIEKLKNIFYVSYDIFWWRFWYLPKQEDLVKSYFKNLPTPAPSLEEIERNASLVLLNSHFSLDTPIAHLPGIVEIGGVQLEEGNATLPMDLQKKLDHAQHGAIYVSFGSLLRSAELPNDKVQAFLSAFRRLKQTVLWKWEGTESPGQAENVLIRSWFPQKDILKHPNIRAFITHGGLLSQHEAVFHGIPIIGIPIYGDQRRNVKKTVKGGFGLQLNFNDITEEKVYELLSEILNKESYSRKAKEVSRRFRDRPMRAIDTAMYWIEYVIRHKGATHMRSPGLDLVWYSHFMLDVAVAFLIITIMVLYFVVVVSKFLKSIFTKRTKVTKKKKW